uniref:glycogenin glucosyltransferase n=2 Tax=Ornithodoros turicata TaxID=34597 RepID=A0A2R5LNJ9_9ACAR
MLDLVQEHLLEPSQPIVKSQAYVTMAGNDLTAMLCLVLGNSLRVTGTTRTLVVLVTDGVSPALRHLLSSVFNLVQSVRSLGTQGTTKLTLLEQPDIGVSFTKLHAWRLTQFSKCVFLDAATMMVQCCDELFEREELSAVPDIGWPDCFNSGVFVYVPCMETFWDLVSFAERQGSFDGGDQGLLNMYFRNWSSDINRRLPFIYNLMANVSYTYKPAFKQFGKNVKIVQFFGGYKPWNVKFHAPTGQMSPAAGVHPTFAQFVQFWLHIYARRVLPMFSQPLQEKARDSQYICALDLLQHFPSFLTSEPVVTLPTPSFRSHPKPIIYLPPSPRMPPEIVEAAQSIEANAKPEVHASSVSSVSEPSSEESGPSVPTDTGTEETFAEEVDMKQTRAEQATSVKQHAFVEDLSGMLAWEQGRADYMGEHRSDNIIARLDQLIKHSSTEQCVMIKD